MDRAWRSQPTFRQTALPALPAHPPSLSHRQACKPWRRQDRVAFAGLPRLLVGQPPQRVERRHRTPAIGWPPQYICPWFSSRPPSRCVSAMREVGASSSSRPIPSADGRPPDPRTPEAFPAPPGDRPGATAHADQGLRSQQANTVAYVTVGLSVASWLTSREGELGRPSGWRTGASWPRGVCVLPHRVVRGWGPVRAGHQRDAGSSGRSPGRRPEAEGRDRSADHDQGRLLWADRTARRTDPADLDGGPRAGHTVRPVRRADRPGHHRCPHKSWRGGVPARPARSSGPREQWRGPDRPTAPRGTVLLQQMDAPRPQRNRIHVDVWVPYGQAEARIAAPLAVGGRLVNDADAPSNRVLADPEGNEACVGVAGPPGPVADRS
ncbi:VOC family protein [Streptomyces sp. NPDC005244]|uniref:VOC family protein n=1 Tax=Streptomyces sp. NPDC005244 TaxID=3364708 RepID=UPI0036992C41